MAATGTNYGERYVPPKRECPWCGRSFRPRGLFTSIHWHVEKTPACREMREEYIRRHDEQKRLDAAMAAKWRAENAKS